eukprot:4969166-Heterocapsa_arctica.AAC.1
MRKERAAAKPATSRNLRGGEQALRYERGLSEARCTIVKLCEGWTDSAANKDSQWQRVPRDCAEWSPLRIALQSGKQ